jgi:ABC-type bacteriocin/lantibiotic exporter with double-glycine peptidase domain
VTDSTRPVNRSRSGWSLSQIATASRDAGLNATVVRIPRERIPALELPAIALLGTHYVVIERRTSDGGFIVIDPDIGRMKAGIGYLTRDWTGHVVIFPQTFIESNLRSHASAPDRHLRRMKSEATTATDQRSCHA